MTRGQQISKSIFIIDVKHHDMSAISLSPSASHIHIVTSWLGQMAGGVFVEGRGACDEQSWLWRLSTSCSHGLRTPINRAPTATSPGNSELLHCSYTCLQCGCLTLLELGLEHTITLVYMFYSSQKCYFSLDVGVTGRIWNASMVQSF